MRALTLHDPNIFLPRPKDIFLTRQDKKLKKWDKWGKFSKFGGVWPNLTQAAKNYKVRVNQIWPGPITSSELVKNYQSFKHHLRSNPGVQTAVIEPSKKFDPGRVGSNFWCSGWVALAIFGLSLGLENFPQKSQIFQFFAIRVKKNLGGLGQKVPWLASYLLRVKSMLVSCQGPSLLL